VKTPIENKLALFIVCAAISDSPVCKANDCEDLKNLEHARAFRHQEYETLGLVKQLIRLASTGVVEPRISALINEPLDRERLSLKISKAMQYSFDEKQFEQFSAQREKFLKQLDSVKRRKLRIAFLAKPESGKSFIFNYLISEELSIKSNIGKVESLGPSPSDFKEGSGVTGIPIWAEHGDTPEVHLIRDDKPESVKYHKASDETLARMKKQIADWDKTYRNTTDAETSRSYYVLVKWPSRWLKESNCTLIDVTPQFHFGNYYRPYVLLL